MFRFRKIKGKKGLQVGVESLIKVHPVIINTGITELKLKEAKKNFSRFHEVSQRMLNDVNSIFLALNKPMKDTWNNGKSFTHIPLDAFFYSFKQITEVFIQGNLVSKRDKPQRSVPDKI